MKKGIFDEHKGVYRVENADGTFDTYTPAQYAELVDTSVEAEEEEEETNTEEFGTPIVTTEKGSIQEVPVELGEAWVAQGLAEGIIEPTPETKTGIISKIIGK